MKPLQKLNFAKFADAAAYALGSEAAFASAIALVGLWLLLGPSSRYSDRWELLINSVTNVVTFLMVFLLQNTQNRDTHGLNERLDRIEELLRRISSSRSMMQTILGTGVAECVGLTKIRTHSDEPETED